MSSKHTSTRRRFAKQLLLAFSAIMSGWPSLRFFISSEEKTIHIPGFQGTKIPIPGKSDQLIILNDRPLNAETPAHLLGNRYTPNDLFFVRNNGIPPEKVDIKNWLLEISGESVKTPKTYSINDLKNKFKHYTYHITLECGGNSRNEFYPPANGLQWSTGAVGCAAWTGVRLKDVLEDAGIKANAVYIGYYGRDTHISGDKSLSPISRGVPIQKAMEDESLIAWAMNGEDMPLVNGHPLRLVFGGYPASCSGKWLYKIAVRDKVHDGSKMDGYSYRIPCNPVSPGDTPKQEDMCIIEKMPVKSIITSPKSGGIIKKNQTLTLKGQAWTSAERITTVEVSSDFGKSWKLCSVSEPTNRFAWQQWEGKLSFPSPGYYEVYVRATDSVKDTQTMLLPGWNPYGYLNNACHRIAIKVNA